MNQKMQDNIVKLSGESIIRSLFRLAVPVMMYHLLHISYQLVNTFWVGRLGAKAFAAVAISFPVLFFMISVAGGLSVAASILVAQYAGARDFPKLNYVASQSTTVIVLIALAISLLCYQATPQLLGLIGASGDILADAEAYMRISFLSIVFIYVFSIFESLLRGVGEVKVPLVIVASSVVLNIVLDPILIFGWGPIEAKGVVGAAYATLITQGVVSVVCTGILISGRFGIQLQLRHCLPEFEFFRKFIALGLPASIQQIVQSMTIAIMTALVAGFGALNVAAYGIAFRMFMLATIPAMSISMATATMVGMSVGAGDQRRARDVGMLSGWLTFMLLSTLGLTIFVLSEQIIRFFIPHDATVVETGSLFLKIVASSLGFIGAFITLSGFFSGAGKTTSAMVLAMISLFVLQLPSAYFLSQHTELGVLGVLYAYPLTGICTILLAVVQFNRTRLDGIIHDRGDAIEKGVVA